MEWLEDNAMLVSALATVVMAIIWLLYAHIGIVSILRQRRPRIIVDQTAERTLETKFVIANLSSQPVYVSCVMITVHSGEERKTRRITTYRHFLSGDESDEPSKLESELRHGVLNPGEMLLLGDSDRTLSWLLDQGDREDEEFELPRGQRLRQTLSEIDRFEIRVVAMVGVEDKPIASRRTFLIENSDNEVYIWPEYSQTQHLFRMRDRRKINEWSDFCLKS